jgi:hypothetical protein
MFWKSKKVLQILHLIYNSNSVKHEIRVEKYKLVHIWTSCFFHIFWGLDSWIYYIVYSYNTYSFYEFVNGILDGYCAQTKHRHNVDNNIFISSTVSCVTYVLSTNNQLEMRFALSSLQDSKGGTGCIVINIQVECFWNWIFVLVPWVLFFALGQI